MTNLNELSTFEQPHRQPREFLDCPAAPLDPDTTEIGQDETLPVPEGAYLELDEDEPEVRHERPDPYDEMVDRQAVERDRIERGVQSDMSDLGKFLCETMRDITRVYMAKGEL
jgi:hypothetical protein